MSKDSVLRIFQLTRPLKDLGSSLWVSIDEHVVPRWTQAFKLKKAHHPTRGRKMKADKLFYVYELAKDLLLSLKVSSGKKKLSCHLLKMVKEILSIPGVDILRVIFDAGGYRGSVFARLKAMEKVNFLTKAVRYSKNVEQWEKVEDFTDYTPPRDRKLPREKGRHLKIADCRTKIRGCKDDLRTILLEKPEGKGKDRFCGLLTNGKNVWGQEIVTTPDCPEGRNII